MRIKTKKLTRIMKALLPFSGKLTEPPPSQTNTFFITGNTYMATNGHVLAVIVDSDSDNENLSISVDSANTVFGVLKNEKAESLKVTRENHRIYFTSENISLCVDSKSSVGVPAISGFIDMEIALSSPVVTADYIKKIGTAAKSAGFNDLGVKCTGNCDAVCFNSEKDGMKLYYFVMPLRV